MLSRYLFLGLLFILVSSINAREYLVSQALSVDSIDPTPGQVTLVLYATAEGGEPLEIHALPATQWQLEEEIEDVVLLQANLDTHLSQPLWAEVSLDGQPMSQRSQLRAPGDLTTQGEIHSLVGFRFPDDSLQISAANTEALDNVLGGGSNCPAGSSIRAIDANGNVTCEFDDVGSGTVTQVDTGPGLTGGPITTTGTISVAENGINGGMIQDNTVGSADIQDGGILAEDIDSNQVQRRVSGSCPQGYMLTGINVDGSLLCTSIYDLIPLPPRSFTVDSSNFVGRHTSLAQDVSNHPVISYYDGANGDLKLVHCNDPACSGSDETISPVDSSGDDVGWDTSLVLDGSGHPVVSYYDVTNYDLKLAHCNDPACSGGDEAITTVDSSDAVGWNTSLALDASGHPVVSYYDLTNDDLKLAHCNDINCSGGDEAISTVDSNDEVGRYSSLVLDASGHPVISYWDVTNDDLKLVHCNDPNCDDGDEVISTVDSTGFVGAFTSLELDASGHPVISYYDDTNHDLKLVHCNDPNCMGNNEAITTVDSNGDVGWFTSLVLDASGHPVISYWDVSNDDLKLVHCNDPNCSGDEVSTTVDSSGDVGQYISLALDANDHPVISYSDSTNFTLKVAKCGTPDCR